MNKGSNPNPGVLLGDSNSNLKKLEKAFSLIQNLNLTLKIRNYRQEKERKGKEGAGTDKPLYLSAALPFLVYLNSLWLASQSR
jgi:hypothetical protein